MRKATGSYRTYSIHSKTGTLVPKFAVEDLPSAELQPSSCGCSEGPALGQNTDDDEVRLLIFYLSFYVTYILLALV